MPFFGIEMKIDLFQSWGHCWFFQIFCHIECSTLTGSSFRIWNSSTEIWLHLLALCMVMLPKAQLTSHSGYLALGEWSHCHGYLGHDLLYCSFVYSCHLFLTSSASFRSIQFLSFIVPIVAWSIPLVLLNFFKRPLVFPILLFSSISLH